MYSMAAFPKNLAGFEPGFTRPYTSSLLFCRLEEATYDLRDELERLQDVVKREEAWSIIFKYAQGLAAHFESDAYEACSADVYRRHLEELQKKRTVFMVWLHKFNQKLELERSARGARK
jgi:hypothetical protein